MSGRGERRGGRRARRSYPLAQPDLGGHERRYLLDALRENEISSLGRHVREFEQGFAAALRARHAVAVSSGTAALHLALAALGVGPGDEVVVPDLTFVATANAVRYTGARVVLADVDPASWTLAPAAVEAVLTRRTRAILAVHLYGVPADLDALARIARPRGIALVEDAAEALGALWRGRPVGSFGACGCFSLYGNKFVTTGEGGMVLARSAALAQRLRHLRDHGMSPRRRYWHDELAFNYRLTALQAAVGCAQLERLPRFLAQRARIARWYRAHLSGADRLHEPMPPPQGRAVNWLYSVRVEGWTRAQRDRALELLRRRGVDARPLFFPMSRLPMYRTRALPVAARLSASGLSLPTYTALREPDVAAIAAIFRGVLAEVDRRRGGARSGASRAARRPRPRGRRAPSR